MDHLNPTALWAAAIAAVVIARIAWVIRAELAERKERAAMTPAQRDAADQRDRDLTQEY